MEGLHAKPIHIQMFSALIQRAHAKVGKLFRVAVSKLFLQLVSFLCRLL